MTQLDQTDVRPYNFFLVRPKSRTKCFFVRSVFKPRLYNTICQHCFPDFYRVSRAVCDFWGQSLTVKLTSKYTIFHQKWNFRQPVQDFLSTTKKPFKIVYGIWFFQRNRKWTISWPNTVRNTYRPTTSVEASASLSWLIWEFSTNHDKSFTTTSGTRELIIIGCWIFTKKRSIFSKTFSGQLKKYRSWTKFQCEYGILKSHNPCDVHL